MGEAAAELALLARKKKNKKQQSALEAAVGDCGAHSHRSRFWITSLSPSFSGLWLLLEVYVCVPDR